MIVFNLSMTYFGLLFLMPPRLLHITGCLRAEEQIHTTQLPSGSKSLFTQIFNIKMIYTKQTQQAGSQFILEGHRCFALPVAYFDDGRKYQTLNTIFDKKGNYNGVLFKNTTPLSGTYHSFVAN